MDGGVSTVTGQRAASEFLAAKSRDQLDRETAGRVGEATPGVPEPAALAVIRALRVLGWRP